MFNFGKKKTQTAEQTRIETAKKHYIEGAIGFLDFLGEYSGSKIDFEFGGFGRTRPNKINLISLQQKSQQLYNENPYAASIVNRIVTKTVNCGYGLRTTPIKKVLDFLPDNYFKEFSEQTEALFYIWSEDKRLVSLQEDKTLSDMQSLAMRSSLINGDCLCINYYNSAGLPTIEIVDGINIQTPALMTNDKNIIDGVEYNAKGQIIAFHIYQCDLMGKVTYKRVEAKDRSGRLKAWLVRSGNPRIDNARGMPLLAVVLQNLNDVGRYLDSEQRSALVNSYIAVVHEKAADMVDNVDRFLKAGTETAVTVTGDDGATKDLNFKKMNPGFFATNLEKGETIKSFDTSRPNVNFGNFTDVITKPMFYVHGIPPEVLKMEYNSNYSASRAAIIDFEHRARELNYVFNGSFSAIIYYNWLDSMVLKGDIIAPKYIESIKNINNWSILGAYRSHIWRGLPKINIDGFKQAKENEIAVKNGWTTNEQIADEQYSTDYQTNMDAREKEAEREKKINDILALNQGIQNGSAGTK